MGKGARESGNTIRAIAKVSLTGITRPRRSSTRPLHGKPVKPENPSVAAQIRAGRIYHEAVEIVEALTAGAVAGIPFPIAAAVIARLVGVSVEVKQGRRAAVVVQAAGVPEEDSAVADLGAAEAAVVAVAAVEDDDKDWLKMFNIVSYKLYGGENDAY